MKPPFEKVVAQHGATVLRGVRAGPRPADAADANLEAWLVTIAHRKAIDITRATSRRAIPIADTPDTPSRDHAGEPHPDLAEAVAALPTKPRQAVAYHYLAGLPYA